MSPMSHPSDQDVNLRSFIQGHSPTGTSPVLHYTIPPSLYNKTDKGAIGSNTCHLPEAVTSVSHVQMTKNLHYFVQK